MSGLGGVTMLCDMPLNSIPPTTTTDGFREKMKSADGKCWVDVGFYGGVVPGNQGELKKLLELGVKGFKCFLIESGVDEFPFVKAEDVRKALVELKNTNSFLMFHAEIEPSYPSCCAIDRHDHNHNDREKEKNEKGETLKYETFLKSRPKSLENDAIDLVIQLCRESNVRCHIVHLSSAEAIDKIRQVKAEGLPITVETCFHYLFFSSEEIPDGATQFKCCPPIRERDNRESLWHGLLDGTIDYVVSDHSPCTEDLKLIESGNFMDAWGGISSLQYGLSILWTCGQSHGVSIQDIVRWLCEQPAKQLNLSDKKGKLEVGYDADIVIWNDYDEYEVKKEGHVFRNKVCPYEGQALKGVVKTTIVRGQVVDINDKAKGCFQLGEYKNSV